MKIKAWNKPWDSSVEFLIYEDNKQGRSVALPCELVFKQVKEDDNVKPTFSVSQLFSHEFVKAMAELAEEMGVKTDKQIAEEQKTGGVLEATKYHLEDMRKLVLKEFIQMGVLPVSSIMPKIVDSCCINTGHEYEVMKDNSKYKVCKNGCGSIIPNK